MDTTNVVRSYIIDNFLFDDGNSLNDDESLLENGIIDSTGIMELVSFIEDEFGIIVEDEELIPENLDGIANIVRFTDAKRKDRP